MKFSEHLSSHLTPEWRTQYINYEFLKEYLYKCLNERSNDYVTQEQINGYYLECDVEFIQMCLQELKKINNFFSEKLSEAKRKFDNLKQELDTYHEHVENKHANSIFSRFSAAEKKTPTESFHCEGNSDKIPLDDLVNQKKSGLGAAAHRRLSVVQNFKQQKFQQWRIRKKVKTLHDLKLGFSEFYLSLILLQNYQSLNFTGFRKILKKHDKLFNSITGFIWRTNNVDKSEFHTNTEVDELIVQIETVYTKELESGDRQKAMKRLRVPPLAELENSWSTFRLGFFLGIFVIQSIVICITVYVNYAGLPKICAPAVRIFRSSFLLLSFMFMIGVNIYYWRRSGVNHVLIFEIDPRDHLTPTQLMEKSLRLMVIWGCCVTYFIFSPLIRCPAYIGPFALVIILLTYLLNPLPLFNHKSRRWLLIVMQRIVLAPFYTVKFADFWVADQLNSLSFLFVDLGYFVCFFGFNIQWNNGFKTTADLVSYTDDYIFNAAQGSLNINSTVSIIDNQICNSLWFGINPLLRALPAWFRFAQCLRRYYDNYPKTHELFPHIVNAGKYLSGIIVVIVSVFYAQYHQSKISLSALLIACIINSVYTCGWDVLMDWGLFDRNAQEDKILRDELVYQYRIYYYLAIIENVIGRLMWVILVVLYKFPPKDRDMIVSVVMFVEVVRRFIWNFFRLENEHLNNVGEFRAVRDIFIAPIKPFFGTEASEIKLNAINKLQNSSALSAIDQYCDVDKESDDGDDKANPTHDISQFFLTNKWKLLKRRMSAGVLEMRNNSRLADIELIV